VFEIASVTKTFTATLLAEMAGRGEAQLDQPVQELLPPDVKVPSRFGRLITLAQLAEHTSSLPRLPGNLDATITDPANPYKDYDVAHLYEGLNRTRLAFPPGSGVAYSNFGTGLLGHALGLKAGKPFDELLTERVLRPLGMTDTAVSLTDDQTARMAQGHDEKGKPTSNWTTPALGGAGALRSTVAEMLVYLRANLHPADTPLRDALETCHTPRPVAWWRRVPVGLWLAVLLAALSAVCQWWFPVPPGRWQFLALVLLPPAVCWTWKGFWSGVWAAVLVWAGTLALWGESFGWLFVAGLFATAFVGYGFLSGYVPPPRRAMLGWQTTTVNGQKAWWHNGGTGGFASFVAFARNPDVAVVVLSNSANGVDELAGKLLEFAHASGRAIKEVEKT
jgi:CubicO group peptidase (beta-lactamase class C family)